MVTERPEQDRLFTEALASHGEALGRLVHAYESHPESRKDLLQDIHMALWRSLASFNGRCSLRTWVYRVAHNTVTSRVLRPRGRTPPHVSLDMLADEPTGGHGESAANDRVALERLLSLVRRLEPLDRRVILLYLEDLDAAAIGEVTGLSAGNVATKVHRIKQVLARQFNQSVIHGR
jgi:RNA polymerase sigma-70 factor (ECF subfamily)